MRNLFYSGLLIMSLLSPTFAGDKVGNGGGAVVCRSLTDNSVFSSELLDLWEGKEFLDLSIPESSKEVNEQHLSALEVIRNVGKPEKKLSDKNLLNSISDFTERIYLDILEATRHIDNSTSDLPLDMGINLTNDIYAVYYKKTLRSMSTPNLRCGLEMVAYYRPDGTLERDTEIYDHFTLTSKAALKTHESIYKAAREFSTFAHGKKKVLNDSRDVRELVAYLYSQEPDQGKILNSLHALFGYRPTEQKYVDVKPDDHQETNLRISILTSKSLEKGGFIDSFIDRESLRGVQLGYNAYLYDETRSNPVKISGATLDSKQNPKERFLLSQNIQDLRHKIIYIEGFFSPRRNATEYLREDSIEMTVAVKLELLGNNDVVLAERSGTLIFSTNTLEPFVMLFCELY
ncbi:MAG: hypothetical protein A2Z91_07090 [Deltaproteobacteria bacterium GWA2_38_16]|nr:MAG: hypothetical protein A2Z91_07090 [Deltaproteobacteria bacterium GWA2_38_16]OGQ02365.1 MAG: hypothetical protein A3D19_05935 [Deltaproteobacteria bacterium RIFCSPHIGHO2_02_FULL_38_15]OGQ34443.1 MAG: hypothetical protein A3A72_01010 [Deltaproteobacteria bacterium RIFCSPLOWO2_01_FULL_38_9]OGQ63799.1 MAG: hypothetical protein A3G92_06725 [Deltaproteobacteria bacterium RIFCSPLOWO2_12_FULL_38_8]HBQ20698.1 hypothetical protein [Deltaproteobacteria bacterium]